MQNSSEKNINFIIKATEKAFFEDEKKFLNSQERINLGWNVHQIKTRIIKTSVGILHLKRYFYIDKKGKYHYYQNPNFDIPYNKNIDDTVIQKTINLKKEGNSNRAICQSEFNNMISLQTVTNITKSQQQIQKINFKCSSSLNETLYLEVDDTFLNLRNNHNKVSKNRARVLVLHKGKDKNNKIIDKTTVVKIDLVNSNNSINKEFINAIKKVIFTHYANNYKQIVMYGDGAPFMRRLAKALNAEYILDWFHVVRKLFILCGFDKYNTENKRLFMSFLIKNHQSLFQLLRKLLIKGEWKQVINLLEIEFKNNWDKVSSKKKKLFEDYKKYLKNNGEFITKYEEKYHIGSHTEAFISHQIKKHGTKKFSIYGINFFKTILISNLKDNENLIFL
ncbi:Uncharacterised protein [Mycoplasmopsis citelli]|uniref:Transposase n=1 Tax=Mycoplasmopsis citelli TaxID=171281 RepID=A0A449B137_9BACT|nr:hypothetical protein [Mycoplasmopsis citelli]VEU74273.1 Uncharacterised protein [Mycoplasmopsis citelli]